MLDTHFMPVRTPAMLSRVLPRDDHGPLAPIPAILDPLLTPYFGANKSIVDPLRTLHSALLIFKRRFFTYSGYQADLLALNSMSVQDLSGARRVDYSVLKEWLLLQCDRLIEACAQLERFFTQTPEISAEMRRANIHAFVQSYVNPFIAYLNPVIIVIKHYFSVCRSEASRKYQAFVFPVFTEIRISCLAFGREIPWIF